MGAGMDTICEAVEQQMVRAKQIWAPFVVPAYLTSQKCALRAVPYPCCVSVSSSAKWGHDFSSHILLVPIRLGDVDKMLGAVLLTLDLLHKWTVSFSSHCYFFCRNSRRNLST